MQLHPVLALVIAASASSCAPGPVDGDAPGSEGHQSPGADYILSGEEFDANARPKSQAAPAIHQDCAAEGIAYQAHRMVQGVIRKKAREPSSTEFPLSSMRSELFATEPCQWLIFGEGRSKNAFGSYSIVSYMAIAKLENDRYSIENLKVEER